MNNQGWTDFQSGACTCRRSTDYDSIRGGADDYESTVGAESLLNGQGYTMDPNKTASQRLAGMNMGANMGITYSTSGGRRRRGRPRKSTKKRSQKGGQETTGATPRPSEYYNASQRMGMPLTSSTNGRDVGNVDLMPRDANGVNPFLAKGGFTPISQSGIDMTVNSINGNLTSFEKSCNNVINAFDSSQQALAEVLGATTGGGKQKNKQEQNLIKKIKDLKRSVARYRKSLMNKQKKRQINGGGIMNSIRNLFSQEKENEHHKEVNQSNYTHTGGKSKKKTTRKKSTKKKTTIKKSTKKKTTSKKTTKKR